MKRIISVCIISAFVLTAFTGCTKFRETTRDFQKPPQHSDSSDAAPIVNNKESWSEWTSRQWNKSSVKWIGSIAGAALVATGLYFGYKKLWSKKVEKIYKFKRRDDNSLNSAGRPMYQRASWTPSPNAFYKSDDGYTIKWENVGNSDNHKANYENGRKDEIPQEVLDKVRVKQSWWAFWRLW